MMRLVTEECSNNDKLPAEAAPQNPAWPIEVDMILSAMEAARTDASDLSDRRKHPRATRRVQAELQLFAHNPLQPPIQLYTRDISASGIGFITRERLTLGYNGLVAIHLNEKETITAQCNVYRCREAINGWYEGALAFTVEQPTLG